VSVDDVRSDHLHNNPSEGVTAEVAHARSDMLASQRFHRKGRKDREGIDRKSVPLAYFASFAVRLFNRWQRFPQPYFVVVILVISEPSGFIR
jgi:hypothetical protein